jgi:hypothetical protein
MNDRPINQPSAAGPWRLLVLLTAADDPIWVLATITLPSDVRAADMEPGGRRYRGWPDVMTWVAHQVGHPVSAVPLSGMLWRLDARRPR